MPDIVGRLQGGRNWRIGKAAQRRQCGDLALAGGAVSFRQEAGASPFLPSARPTNA